MAGTAEAQLDDAPLTSGEAGSPSGDGSPHPPRPDHPAKALDAAFPRVRGMPRGAAIASNQADASVHDSWLRDLASGGYLYFQIDDLLSYLHHHKTVSGIQRVQLGIVNHVLALTDADPAGVVARKAHFVVVDPAGNGLRVVPVGKLRDLAAYLAGPAVEHEALRRRIVDATSNSNTLKPSAGDVLVLLGAFWGVSATTRLLRELKSQGVKSCVYFYDLIPVTHPEFCDAGLVALFTQSLIEILSLIDFGLAISEYTANEVRRFQADTGFPIIPVQVVPLAHTFSDVVAEPVGDNRAWPASIAALQGRRYVLCVATIEARKNHRYLFDAWKALASEGDVPDLVFVGRRGWRVEDLFQQFAATNYLNGRLRILHDLSDAELATLYRNCLFTIFPSVVEGWGLPIGESLTYGKLCVASDAASMPEVGGDLVQYIDPLNLRGGIAVLRSLIADPAQVQGWEATIQEHFVRRDWAAVTRHLLAVVARLAAAHPGQVRPYELPPLNAGAVFRPASLATPGLESAVTTRARRLHLILHDHWYPLEEFGSWMNGQQGHVSFMTDCGPDRPIVVFLKLRPPPYSERSVITIHDDQSMLQRSSIRNVSDFATRIKTRTNRAGEVRLRFSLEEPPVATERDTRALGMGLLWLGFAAADDWPSRAELSEELLLG